MIGNVQPRFKKCDAEAKDSYMRSYCSLCAGLKNNHGLIYSALLSNEISLVLNALEPDMDIKIKQTACPARLYLKGKPAYSNDAVGVAAALSLILSEIKFNDYLVDNQNDGWVKYQLAKKAHKQLTSKRKDLDSQLSHETKEAVDKYNDIGVNPNIPFTTSVALTHDLSKRIAMEIAERTNASEEKVEVIGELFGHFGEIITFLDHIIDLDKDLASSAINPIVVAASENNTDISTETARFFDEYLEVENKIKGILKNKAELLPVSFNTTMHNALKHNYKRMIELSGHHFKNYEQIEYLQAAAFSCDDKCCCGCMPDCSCCCGDC